MLRRTDGVVLFGFYSYELECLRKKGVHIAACIQVMERKETLDFSELEIYDHFKVVRCDVPSPLRGDFSAEIRDKLYAKAFARFRRHFHRVMALSRSIRSWSNLDHQFHIAASFFFDLLTRTGARTVVFSNFPHEGSAIILYELARLLGLQTIICTQALFPGKLWIVSTIDDFGKFRSVAGEGIPLEAPRAPETPFYMKNVSNLRRFQSLMRVSREIAKLVLKTISLRAWFDGDSLDRSMNRLNVALERFHLGNPSPRHISNVDLSEPFIYFPLHLQPEMTTETWAEKYADQLTALEELALAAPDIKIYVKENPVQGRFLREQSFFRRLEAIPNALYVASEVPTFELIRKCMCVATITGTAGWEAALLGKSAIIFGVTWYSNLPGVFLWSGPETLAKALAFRADRSDFERAFDGLSKKLYSGVLDKAYAEIVPGFDRAAAAEAAAASIHSVIEEQRVPA